MPATPIDSTGLRRETIGFVIARVVSGASPVRRYIQSVHTRNDGAVAALAYGALQGAHIFADLPAAQRLAARLAESRVFGAQPHRVEPLDGAAGATG